MSQEDILSQLITMSRSLGDPSLDYVILGEGNTSARIDADTFWVKASGTELRTIDRTGFVRMRFDQTLALLKKEGLDDDDVRVGLATAKVDATVTARPSVETALHALALQVEDVNFVGHTHPTAINALTCSAAFETVVSGRLFPDEIVTCGPAPVVVPYTDPGAPLARRVGELINGHIDEFREVPKTILIQNHGLITLGDTAKQVEDITAMAVKTARVLLGTYALGGPHFLAPGAVARIYTRPDELYRRGIAGDQNKS